MQAQLTLEQRGSIYTWIFFFNKNTVGPLCLHVLHLQVQSSVGV